MAIPDSSIHIIVRLWKYAKIARHNSFDDDWIDLVSPRDQNVNDIVTIYDERAAEKVASGNKLKKTKKKNRKVHLFGLTQQAFYIFFAFIVCSKTSFLFFSFFCVAPRLRSFVAIDRMQIHFAFTIFFYVLLSSAHAKIDSIDEDEFEKKNRRRTEKKKEWKEQKKTNRCHSEHMVYAIHYVDQIHQHAHSAKPFRICVLVERFMSIECQLDRTEWTKMKRNEKKGVHR